MRVRLIDVEPRPDVFAAVMATGIVSVSAADHRYRWISDTLAGVALLGLVVMIVLVLRQVGRVGFPYPLSDIESLSGCSRSWRPAPCSVRALRRIR